MLGAEQVVLALCGNSVTYGYDTVLAVTQDHGDAIPDLHAAAAALGIQSHVIGCRHKFDIRAITQLHRLIESQEIDVLHCHGYRENFYAVAARVPIKTVTTNHLWKRTTRTLRVYAAVDSWLMRRFDRVVAVSHEILRELEGNGLRAPRLAYIPNGVDTVRYAPSVHSSGDLQARRARLGVRHSEVVLGTIGSLTEEKGHAYLLRAIANLGKDANVKLLVVGDGPRSEYLRRVAQDLGIAHAVTFLGRREDIPDILAIMDVFVLPSLIEGLPIALLEAMACGTACVATDVGDVARVIATGVTGMLVQKADSDGLRAAIEQLVENPELRTRLGEAARQRVVEQFSAARMTAAYCAMYDSLIAESRAASR